MGRLIKWKILKDLEKGLCHLFFPAENVLNRRDVLNRSQRFSIPDNLPLKGNPMVSGKKRHFVRTWKDRAQLEKCYHFG